MEGKFGGFLELVALGFSVVLNSSVIAAV